MRRSTDRILTTHVGALQRPAELSKAMAAHGQWSPDVLDLLRASVTEVVRRQTVTGIDVVDDGEFGKTMWSWYIRDRLDGIEGRELASREVVTGRDRAQFPGFYAWAEANASLFGYQVAASAPAFRPAVKAARPRPAGTERFCCPVDRRRTPTGAPPAGRRAPGAVTARRRPAEHAG